MVELLLQNGASWDCRDALGRTPLHYTIIFNQPHIAKALLQRGADRYSILGGISGLSHITCSGCLLPPACGRHMALSTTLASCLICRSLANPMLGGPFWVLSYPVCPVPGWRRTVIWRPRWILQSPRAPFLTASCLPCCLPSNPCSRSASDSCLQRLCMSRGLCLRGRWLP